MNKYIYDRRNELWYELQGDYYLPCLKLPEESEVRIGIWGRRHQRYLKTHRRAMYASLLTSGKLNGYFADIDRQAEELFSRLVKQLSEAEHSTEKIKTDDPMAWVSKMSNIRSKAAEFVNAEIIYK